MSKKSCCGGCAGSKILWALVIIGAVNWGLVGLFDLDLVALIFGSIAWLQTLVYILVGVAGVALLFGGCRCRMCNKSCMSAAAPSSKKNDDACCGGGCCHEDEEETDNADSK